MHRPKLCGDADGIAIPQGQQGLVASHQGLGQAKSQRRQQRAQHRQVVAIREVALLKGLRLHQFGQAEIRQHHLQRPEAPGANNLPGTLAG